MYTARSCKWLVLVVPLGAWRDRKFRRRGKRRRRQRITAFVHVPGQVYRVARPVASTEFGLRVHDGQQQQRRRRPAAATTTGAAAAAPAGRASTTTPRADGGGSRGHGRCDGGWRVPRPADTAQQVRRGPQGAQPAEPVARGRRDDGRGGRQPRTAGELFWPPGPGPRGIQVSDRVSNWFKFNLNIFFFFLKTK